MRNAHIDYRDLDALIESVKASDADVPRATVLRLIDAVLVLRSRLYRYEFSPEREMEKYRT